LYGLPDVESGTILQTFEDRLKEKRTLELYSVWDAYTEIQFNGTRIAHASTEVNDSVRWIEIDIYKTERGKYVIHRVGVSLVYHKHGGPCTGKGVKTRQCDLDNDAVPCKECKPPVKHHGEYEDDHDEFVDAEQDRHTADVCTANELQDKLRVHPGNGKPSFLSSPARKALDQAIAADPSLTEKMASVRFVE
jgi:hypothetical protein